MRLVIAVWLAGLILAPAWANQDHKYQDPQFLEAVRYLEDGKFAKSREIAERILAKDPAHYPALYVMGRVYYYGEGSIPRAYHCFQQAKEELEKSWGNNIPNNGPWFLHSAIYQQLIWSSMQMEHYEEELKLIDEYNKRYQPSLDTQKGWPLLKLGRAEEAREKTKRALDRATDAVQKSHALNTLGNLEFETDNMKDAYEYFMRLCREYDHGPDVDPVYWCNAGEAARDLLRYDEAEKLLLDSTKRFNQYTFSDPWRFLAEMYVGQGRLPEAVQALKEMQVWRLSCSPQVAQNKWAECLSTAGIVLLSLGYDREAYDIFERLASRPDRNSGISTKPSLMEGRNLFFYSLALRSYRQRLLEERSWSPWRSWLSLTYDVWQIDRKIALTETRAADLLCGGTGIVDFLRPYGPRSLDRPWLAPGSWRLFGAGAVSVACNQILKEEKPDQAAHKPYIQAVLAECEAQRGSSSQAEKLINDCLSALPPRESALRVRLQADLASVLESQGKSQEALHSLRIVMEKDPSLLRILELRLPISMTSSGALASKAVSRLQGSPRFTSGSNAFRAEVSDNNGGLHGRLLGPDGTVLKTIDSAAGADAEETVQKFCRAFHDEAFAPTVDLSQADIYSIDSSPQASSSKKLEDLMKN